MEEKEHVPFDLVDVGLAFWVGASPTVAGILLLLAQYTVRHNEDVRGAIVGGATRALPAIRNAALTAKPRIEQQVQLAPNPPVGAAPPPPEPEAAPTEHGPGLLGVLAGKHHLLIVGHTGGGKSVLLHNLAAHLAADGADVLVCDIDSITGAYPGYRTVGGGDDYASVGKALQLVRAQLEQRRAGRAAGTRAFSPLWLFIDEAHDVFATVDGARDLFIDIVRRGRKLNVHAAIGTQDSQVKTLGIEGQSKTLTNLTRVDVSLSGGRRVATLDGTPHPVPDLPHPDDMVRRPTSGAHDPARRPTSGAHDPARRPTSGAHDPAPPPPHHPGDDDLLASLLATPAPTNANERQQRTGERSQPFDGAGTPPNAVRDETTPAPTPPETTPEDHERTARTFELVNQGMGKNPAIEQVWGVKRGNGATYVKAKALLEKALSGGLDVPDKGDGDSSDGGLAKYLGDRTW